jgi:hypothetical protein
MEIEEISIESNDLLTMSEKYLLEMEKSCFKVTHMMQMTLLKAKAKVCF